MSGRASPPPPPPPVEVHESLVSADSAAHTAAARDVISDPLRLWEVRKYCQLLPPPSTQDRRPTPDAAITRLLRSLASQVAADAALVSLVDDTTQHFLAVLARRTASHVWSEAADWYGASSHPHRRGLAAQTLASAGEEHIDERVDLAGADPATASTMPQEHQYRYYASTPLITAQGLPVGVLAFFRESPAATPMSTARRLYLVQMAARVMSHLDISLQAIERARIATSNEAVVALTHNRHASPPAHAPPPPRQPADSCSLSDSEQHAIEIDTPTAVYRHAAQLLLHTFDFDGVAFQEVHPYTAPDTAQQSHATILADEFKPGAYQLHAVPMPIIHRLLECWPVGEAFHRITPPDGTSSTSYMVGSGTSPWTDHDRKKWDVGVMLVHAFPHVQQLVYVPLWDPFHDRVVAIALGFVRDWRRVYTPTSDLFPMTTFCIAVINLVRRKEAQQTEQQKSDFLGSISHEMRSPLHGTLANLELLLETNIDHQQRDMLRNAWAGGQQLLNTIDQILEFTQDTAREGILSPFPTNDSEHSRESHHAREHLSERMAQVAQTNLSYVAEEVIHEVVRNTPFLIAGLPSRSDPQRRLTYLDVDHIAAHDQRRIAPILLDVDWPNMSCTSYPEVFKTVLRHLLSNAIKHTFEGCIRVSLRGGTTSNESSHGTLSLVVADCGTGISESYLKNRLYVPFMQENPLDSGTGLGLATIKRTIDAVGGQIDIVSDKALGTTVTVSLPVLSELRQKPFDEDGDTFRFHEIPLSAQLYVTGRFSRGRRFDQHVRLLQESLSHTLGSCLGIKLQSWDPSAPCDLVIVLEEDWEDFNASMAAGNDCAKRLVLASRPDAPVSITSHANEGVQRLLTQAILPSQLTEMLSEAFLQRQDCAGKQHMKSFQHHAGDVSHSESESRLEPAGLDPSEQSGMDSISSVAAALGEQVLAESATKTTLYRDRDPNILLVDDNLINLKVLGLLIKKCPVAISVAVAGGRDAIEAFKDAAKSSETAFDIVFMDLSMPDISGFDATAAIRQFEAQTPAIGRARILALTGLVSTKDRTLAFEAGVDEYITKPAKKADLQRVVELWSVQQKDGSGGA